MKRNDEDENETEKLWKRLKESPEQIKHRQRMDLINKLAKHLQDTHSDKKG